MIWLASGTIFNFHSLRTNLAPRSRITGYDKNIWLIQPNHTHRPSPKLFEIHQREIHNSGTQKNPSTLIQNAKRNDPAKTIQERVAEELDIQHGFEVYLMEFNHNNHQKNKIKHNKTKAG